MDFGSKYIVFLKIWEIFSKIDVFWNFATIFSFKNLRIAYMPTYFRLNHLYSRVL